MMIFLRVFNDIEKMFGYYKTLSVLAAGFLYNLVLVILEILIPYKTVGLSFRISSGPIGIIFMVLSFYNDIVPATYKFAINSGSHKFVFNDKVFVLILAVLLLVNQGINSAIPSLNGWIIGKLVLNDVLPGKNIKFNFVKREIQRYKSRRSQPRNIRLEEDDDESTNFVSNEEGTDPVRPLGVQLLDTFRT